MIFRFDKYPAIEIYKTINSSLVGFKYRDQRPTSVELTEAELKELLEDKELKRMSSILFHLGRKETV